MANIKKEIVRDEFLKIRVSKEEKEYFYFFAENAGLNPSRLARNILMAEAESTINKLTLKPVVNAYKTYLKLTKQKEALQRIKED